jgi:hypothetical protein
MRIIFLCLLFVGCSKTLTMNDKDLKKIQTERTQNIMLNHNTMIIPPDFEVVPTEKESQYVTPEDNKTMMGKLLKIFNL